jgi:integrase
VHYDENLPGFGLRVTKAGARSIVLNYWVNGLERRMTLDSISLDAASNEEIDRVFSKCRREAARIKAGAKYEGADPMGARHDNRAKPTMRDLADRYIEEHLPKKRSRDDDLLMINGKILPSLGNRRVADLKFADIDALHRKITASGAGVRANRVMSVLSKMFNLAISWDWLSDNPAKRIQRNGEERRQRYLVPDELKRLGNVLGKQRTRSADAISLLLLTGARRGEVLGARWDQFDLEDGIWTKPSAHTKQKKEHRVPISAPARALVSRMRKQAEQAAQKARVEVSPFLFPGRSGLPQKALKRTWATVCSDAKLEGVRLHDLRHSFASILASSGQSLLVIGALLGHTNPATTARYSHLFDDPLREATERVGATVFGKKKNADIVVLSKRAARRERLSVKQTT